MHWIDYLTFTFGCVSACPCLWTDRLWNDYVCSSSPIFTKFCMWLGNVVDSTLFFWDKPEVDIRFSRCANSDFGSLATDRHKNPALKLISVDFLIGCRWNWKEHLDFSDVQNPVSISTSFHKMLYAVCVWKCGWLNAYCFWDCCSR